MVHIWVRVIDKNRNPIEGAYVRLIIKGIIYGTEYTDSSGYAKFFVTGYKLPFSYEIKVEAEGINKTTSGYASADQVYIHEIRFFELPKEEPKPPEPKPPEPKPPEPKRYKIFGYVRDNLGYVVSGALVRLDGRTTTTDGRGYYEFIMDQSGMFKLVVEKSGYEPAEIPIMFLGISDLRQDATLIRKEEPKPPEPRKGEIYELVFVYKKLWYAPANAAERAAEILARATTKVLEKIGGWKYIGKRTTDKEIIIELEKVSSPAIPIAVIIASVLASLIALGIIVYYAYLRKKEERKIVEITHRDNILKAAQQLNQEGALSDQDYAKIVQVLTEKVKEDDIKEVEKKEGIADYLKQTWDMLKYALPIILIVSIIKAVKD